METVKQRLQYLIEHGELYPQPKPLERRMGLALLGLIAALQAVDLLVQLLR